MGVLAEVLVMRLNPEVAQSVGDVLLAVPPWATWGALGCVLPLVAVLAVVRRLRRSGEWWPAPELIAGAYVVAAIMSRVNADVHEELLPEAVHRIVRQDAVAWLVAALLALGGGALVRRFGSRPWMRSVFVAVMVALPAIRLVWQPTPPRQPAEVVARRLGEPLRPLLVVGVEGLDSKVLLVHAGGGRFHTLDELQRLGTWGPLEPHRPYLRRSLWTSTATGTLPGRHGVKSHWGWRLPWFPDEPLRLLPWTPQGSRLILPWGIARRVVPPAASVPPLWERLRASGVTTEAMDWPGIWGPEVTLATVPEGVETGQLDPAYRASLERALEPFADARGPLWQAVNRDHAVVARVVDWLASGARNVWVRLDALSTARRELEPIKAMHTGEREVLDLVIELLDDQLERLVAAADPETLVAVVSPYGLAPPNPWERLRRTLGFGGDWRTSADDCPDGVLLLRGEGVPAGQRFGVARTPDVAPTLCYLLGLPVAQYMEGGVILEAVDREFLSTHALRVVD
jgi:hypothetical protein